MRLYIAIGLAGAIGSIMRFMIGNLIFVNSIFPYATLVVNLLGCYFLAIFVTVLFEKINLSNLFKDAISSGLIGSFTTFSALSVETVELMKSGHVMLGFIYIVISIFGGIFFSRLGFRLGKGHP